MKPIMKHTTISTIIALFLIVPSITADEGKVSLRKAFIDGHGEGWRALGAADFENVNCEDGTWSWKDGVAHCTGKPVGVIASKTPFTNFELVAEWRHLRHAGNSGIFVWASKKSLDQLRAGGKARLPAGIEVQVLDLGYEENWLKNKGAHSNWFTSHGDVFPVGDSKMTARTPTIDYVDATGRAYTVGTPTSSRSFPTKRLVRPAGEWNHYFVRAVDGEVRLTVNGQNVNEASACSPSTGYLALEAEGARVEFRNLRIRELP
jgi:hypothetical protein